MPFTKKTFNHAYNGVIKVGYPTRNIRINMSNDKREIYVTLPKAQVLDNNIASHQVLDSNNNILNPINGNEISQMLEDIKTAHLSEAEEKGLYDEAFNSAKNEITSLLGCFSDYKVIVKTN